MNFLFTGTFIKKKIEMYSIDNIVFEYCWIMFDNEFNLCVNGPFFLVLMGG